jgi:hypothetical protein
MVTIRLPPDFKEFLQLLNSQQVEYLLVGGYAVAYHGYPRATGYAERIVDVMDGVKINFINLQYLKVNKRVSGRLKDLSDLEHLP